MLIFAYEYACASAARGDLPPSLRAEGAAMLRAVLADFERISGVRTTTLLAADFPGDYSDLPQRINGSEESDFRRLAERADFTLVIAPEFAGILTERCCWARIAGGRLLNSTQLALALAADKWRTHERLVQSQVPSAGIQLLIVPNKLDECCAQIDSRPLQFPAVLKPRFGAGSQDAYFVDSLPALRQIVSWLSEQHVMAEMVLCPFVSGKTVSASFITGVNRSWPLLPGEQSISRDDRFRYMGGKIPLSPDLAVRARGLAKRAIEAIPGLLGFVGVDLVLGERPDGANDVVLEINPRLTTSYIGLRRLANTNLAEALINAASGKQVELRWQDASVCFEANGAVTMGENQSPNLLIMERDR